MKKLFTLLTLLTFFVGGIKAETGTETNPTSSTKNGQLDCQSFYIGATYIPSGTGKKYGTMENSGLKLRTGQEDNTLTFTVNSPYTITSMTLDGYANDAGKDNTLPGIIVTKVEVDGVETEFTGGEFPVTGAATSTTLVIDAISAKESITLYFDNSNVTKNSQIVVCWAVDWERPEATQPTITVSPKELALIPTATYNLSAKVDPASFETKWVSDNEAVATVAEDGTVTAVGAGKANISCQWTDDASVLDAVAVTVTDFDPSIYDYKEYDFTTLGDIDLERETDAAGKIWNAAQGSYTENDVYFCTNENLHFLAVQQVFEEAKTNTGWKIEDGQGLLEGGGAGRCAAIGGIFKGQIVEFQYTGNHFYTTSKDSGVEKIALSEGIGRAIFKAEESGMIGFELDKGNYITKIIIYNPTTITASITAAGYASFSSPFAVQIPATVTAYYAVQKDASTITLKEINDGVIPAEEGVVLKGDEGKYDFKVVADDKNAIAGNLLVAQLIAGTPTDEVYYTLAAGPVFKKSAGGVLAGGKAYLVLDSYDARELNVEFDNATGINEVSTVAESSAVYTLSGSRVEKAQKGLYIQNGKKLIVR